MATAALHILHYPRGNPWRHFRHEQGCFSPIDFPSLLVRLIVLILEMVYSHLCKFYLITLSCLLVVKFVKWLNRVSFFSRGYFLYWKWRKNGDDVPWIRPLWPSRISLVGNQCKPQFTWSFHQPFYQQLGDVENSVIPCTCAGKCR